jgi:hypothetical protein
VADWGGFRPDTCETIEMAGDGVDSATLMIDSACKVLTLIYHWDKAEDGREAATVRQRVLLDEIKRGYGHQIVFRCPRCELRCIRLALRPHGMVCAQCGPVVWGANREGKCGRLARRANRIADKLGMKSWAERPMEKPAGMRMRTYVSLLDQRQRVLAKIARHLVVTRLLDALTPAELKRMKKELADEVTRRLAADGFTGARVALAWEADLRHEGQATELTVHYDGDDLAEMSARFVAEYVKTYGYKDESSIELVKLRVVGRGLRERRLDFRQLAIDLRAGAPTTRSRAIHFARGSAAVDTEVVSRSALTSARRRGPLVIEEFDSTTVVPPDASVHRDRLGNIVLDLEVRP